MRRTIAYPSMLITLLVMLFCSLASAQTVVLTQTNRGFYNAAGDGPLGGPQPSGNYFVGDYRDPSGGHGCYPYCGNDYRDYFVFDLAGVTQPILSAQLEVYLPGPGGGGPQSGNGYFSPNPSENYELHDFVTSIAALVAGTGGVVAHTDLGSGVVYGIRTMTAADQGTVVTIELNSSAIAALNAAGTGLLAMGGSLTTLDSIPNYEFVFGSSGGTDITQLRLTLVPEPSSLLLIGIGAISLLGYRSAK